MKPTDCECHMCKPSRTGRVADLATRIVQMTREYTAYHTLVHSANAGELMDDLHAAFAGAAGNIVSVGDNAAQSRELLAHLIVRIQAAADETIKQRYPEAPKPRNPNWLTVVNPTKGVQH